MEILPCYASRMAGQLSTLPLRNALGWTRSDLAREICVSERTIRRIDKGLVLPMPSTQQRLLTLTAQRAPDAIPPGIRRHVVDPERMRYYLTTTCHGWSRWGRRKRGQFRRWRVFYQRIQADAHAGRAYIVYQYRHRAATPQSRLARLLDDAPDLLDA